MFVGERECWHGAWNSAGTQCCCGGNFGLEKKGSFQMELLGLETSAF